MPLIVVESPTKIKTIRKYLSGNWEFLATAGHMYDLPEDEMGIDANYEPEWVLMNQGGNRKRVSQLRSKAKKHADIYLATDPDREGEAIAWQVQNLVFNGTDAARIRLEALTEEQVTRQLENPGVLDGDMVSAQWARRLLDRLAGYKVSPFLMNAFNGKKLSAGRVQSTTLAKIVDRWEEVEAFEPEEFYRLLLQLQPEGQELSKPLEAELNRLQGEAIGTDEGEKLLTDREMAEKINKAVRENGVKITGRKQKETTMNPAPPFNSSELLRRASSWFNWPAGKTMNVAQSLYEKGLITYHRSDSNRISREGCKQAAGYIRDEFGKNLHQWRQAGGGEQEGHEAIRAEYAGLEPEELHSVSKAERILYSAIWQRYIQSQMVSARWDNLRLDVEPRSEISAVFRANLRAIKKWGFFRCQRPGETPLPEKEHTPEDYLRLEQAEAVEVEETEISESQTRGPSLYTEGSLIRMMKDEGIGRPSTYAATIRRLQNRQYVEIEEGKIKPTNRGVDVARFLQRAVPEICDVKLTREMEADLDRIASGELEWKDFIREFDEKLEAWLEAGREVEPEGTAEVKKEEFEYETCPLCDSTLILREGKYGEFVHCEKDDCDFSSNPPAKTYKCPECGRHMVKEKGRNSTVYDCIDPACEGQRPVGKPNMTYEEFQADAPDCPECGETMERRKGRYGKFWGCPNYPDCEGTRSTE